MKLAIKTVYKCSIQRHSPHLGWFFSLIMRKPFKIRMPRYWYIFILLVKKIIVYSVQNWRYLSIPKDIAQMLIHHRICGLGLIVGTDFPAKLPLYSNAYLGKPGFFSERLVSEPFCWRSFRAVGEFLSPNSKVSRPYAHQNYHTRWHTQVTVYKQASLFYLNFGT